MCGIFEMQIINIHMLADHIHLANRTQMPFNRIWRNMEQNHQTIYCH